MATAKKLPSGQWRTLVYDYTDQQGKRHYQSFTADTKKKSEYLAAKYSVTKKQKKHNESSLTIAEAMEQYCAIKSNVLSPSTLRGYRQMQKNCYTDIENVNVDAIDKKLLQIWVNKYSENHSPKSTSNAYGFLTAVIYYFRDDSISFKVTLPAKQKYDSYVPNDKEVQRLIEYYRGKDNDMLIASCLAAFGTLRRSEICGLHSSNVEGNVIHIRQSMVINENKEYVIKDYAKNYTSARDVAMPQFVIDMLPKQGRIVNINPAQLTLRHIKALKKLEINRFRFHDLRHYAASIMHALGVPDQYIMLRGGWSSDRVLKDIYRGTIDEYNTKFENLLFDHYDNMQHGMQHIKKEP